MAELSATARVILGMLQSGPKSGYEIKSKVDNSTRFFWAASYGQIYPELRRLEDTGLVTGVADPQGGRRRTVYSLTANGEAALHGWLTSSSDLTFELRDEALLKFFFSDSLSPEEQLELLRRRREHHERAVAQLQALEPHVKQVGGARYRTLLYGIEHSRWIVEWCRELEAELAGTSSATAAYEGGE